MLENSSTASIRAEPSPAMTAHFLAAGQHVAAANLHHLAAQAHAIGDYEDANHAATTAEHYSQIAHNETMNAATHSKK